MFTNPGLIKEILGKKEYIKQKINVYDFVEDLFNGVLDREALQHSLRIEYPIATALKSQKSTKAYEKEVKKLGEHLKNAWEYGKKHFKMPLQEDFLINLAYIIDPAVFVDGKRYRKKSVRPSGSSITPPYAAKLKLCTDKFFDASNKIYKKSNRLKRKGESISEKCFDIGAWMHLHLVRIHPFEDVNGRTSRMINNLYLKNSNTFPPILIQEGERKDYHQHLEDAIIGFRDRDGERNGALAFGINRISDGEKRFYDFMAGKLNVALDKVIEKKKL